MEGRDDGMKEERKEEEMKRSRKERKQGVTGLIRQKNT